MITFDKAMTEAHLRYDLTLSADALERLIESLMFARSRMKPEVPHEPPEKPSAGSLGVGQAFAFHFDEQGACLLATRNPGFGWTVINVGTAAVISLREFFRKAVDGTNSDALMVAVDGIGEVSVAGDHL